MHECYAAISVAATCAKLSSTSSLFEGYVMRRTARGSRLPQVVIGT